MCPWVGSHAPPFERQLWGLPSRVEYPSPQAVLLPLVYGTTASLWFELRGHSAWQATPSWTGYRLACQLFFPWLWVTFVMVPDGAWPGSDHVALQYRSCPWPGGSAGSPRCVQPMGCWFFPVPRPPYVCAVSRASWLLFTRVLARFVVLCLRCPGPVGPCSPVRPLGVVCCVCGVPGPLAPVHRCPRWVCCVACALSWATWLLFAGVPARCVALRARCPGPLGSCSPVCLLCFWFSLGGVLGHLAPALRCACSACCFVCAVSWASWLLFTGVPGCGVPSLCFPRCTRVRGVLALVAPVHRCARCVQCACAIGGCVPFPPPLIFVFF